MISKKELDSILYLLDDPDPFVNQAVENKLLELGENVIPLLDELKLDKKELHEKEKVSNAIQKITFNSVHADFVEAVAAGINNREDLEKAVLILARIGTPTLREHEYVKKLDHFANMAEASVHYQIDEHQKMIHFTRFIFEDLHFSGALDAYRTPKNSLINHVIDRRKGLPIALALVAIFVARRLNLPFFGVNMPIHFMLMFAGEKEEILLDPYDNGNMVSYEQCYYYLRKNNIDLKPEHLQIAPNIDILKRCIINLMRSYQLQENTERVQDLQQILVSIEPYFE